MWRAFDRAVGVALPNKGVRLVLQRTRRSASSVDVTGGRMNGPLQRLRRLISRTDREVQIGSAALERYNSCVREWNEHFTDDEWCDRPRGQACAYFIEWFDEAHR